MDSNDQIFPVFQPDPEGRRVPVYVRKKAVPFIRAGHPWLFDDSIERVSADAADGDIAVLFGPDKKFLAAGLYDRTSPVRVKVYSNSSKLPPVGAELFAHLAANAAALRAGKIPADTDGWRLIHGDSDGFPGFVADKYANIMVCKIYSAALLPWVRQITEAVAQSVPGIDTLVIRLSRELQKRNGLCGLHDGMVVSAVNPDFDGITMFRENGITFEADVIRGQKTGFFLDQRDNRMRVKDLAANCDCLNVFSYSGGFSLYAGTGGAKSVTSVDLDPHAIAMCDKNWSLNPRLKNIPHHGIAGDAFDVFANLKKEGRSFDLVVVDPPSFAKSAAEVPGALNSYARLAKAAVKVLRKNGTLVFASCSSRVDAETLFSTVSAAAASAGRPLKVFQKTFHAVDHPAKFNESHYLKCLFAKA